MDQALLGEIVAGATHRVVRYLREGGDPDGIADGGLPVIRWCAHHGDVTAIEMLVDRGADLAGLGENLDLHGAAFHGHADLVAWCLAHGADASFQLPATGESPLHAALCKANRPVYGRIVDLLLAHGSRVDARTVPGAPLDSFMRDTRALGETPLHRAAAFAAEEVIVRLLEAGASREAQDVAGQTPLTWASWHLRSDAILRRLCYGPHRIHPGRHGTYDHGAGWGHAELAAVQPSPSR